MKIHATPELCANIYTMLRSTSPFARWKLPPASELVFGVTNSRDRRGEYFWPEIRCATTRITELKSRRAAMARSIL